MKNIFYITALCLLLVSCEEQLQPTFSTEQVGFDGSATEVAYLSDGTGATVGSGIFVHLMGTARSSDTPFSFEIDPTSTALENVHFTINSTSGTIPAGESMVELPLTISPDNFNAGEFLSLKVKITAGGLAGLAEQEFALVATCISTIPDNRTWTALITAGAFGVVTSRDDVTITAEGDGRFLVSDVTAGVYPLLGCCNPEQPQYIKDICGQVQVDGAGPGAQFEFVTNADAGFGPGSWDANTQTLVLSWFDSGNGFGTTVQFTPN